MHVSIRSIVRTHVLSKFMRDSFNQNFPPTTDDDENQHKIPSRRRGKFMTQALHANSICSTTRSNYRSIQRKAPSESSALEERFHKDESFRSQIQPWSDRTIRTQNQSTMTRKRFIALVNLDETNDALNVAQQKELITLLKSKAIEPELVNSSDEAESQMRDKLLATTPDDLMTDVNTSLPKFFFIDHEGTPSYFSDSDTIQKLNDEGTLSRAGLGLGPADPQGSSPASQRLLSIDESSSDDDGEDEDEDESEEDDDESGEDDESDNSSSDDDSDGDDDEESLDTKNTDRSKPASMISADPKKQSAMSTIMEEEEDLPCCCCVPFSVVGLVSYLLRLDDPYELPASATPTKGGNKVGVAQDSGEITDNNANDA